MPLPTLEEFDRETAQKRARLLKNHSLADNLPTHGVVVRWMGEGGFEPDGNTRKPDVERTITLAPHIIHSPFRGAEHVAFKAPASLNGQGEHVSSAHRKDFVRRYLAAIMDACAPHMIDILAVKGRYSSYVPETFDYENHRDYTDAGEVSRGLYVVDADAGKAYSSCKLEFYIRTDSSGPVKISFDLDQQFNTWKLMPRGVSNINSESISRWDVPTNTGSCHVFRRAGADRNSHGVPTSYTLEWLFDTREALEAMILHNGQ